MATQSVSYRVNNWLACASCLPAEVILCVDVEVVPPDCAESEEPQDFTYTHINGQITAAVEVSGGSCAGTRYYEYTIEYDTDDIVPPLLSTADITGVVCRGCLTEYIDEETGNEIFLEQNEDGTTSLFTQHGCEYLFVSGGELSDLVVDDTDSIDLTLVGVSPKTLTADLIVDPDATNQLSVSPAGVFVSPQWRLLGNSGTVLGVNFLGTTDNVGLDFRVNNTRARRTIPSGVNAANILDGYSGNLIGALCVGSTIAGGGAAALVNNIAVGSFSFIGAGSDNIINLSAFGAENGNFIGAGLSNRVTDGKMSSVVGGESNEARGAWSFIGGGISNICSIASATTGEMVIVGGRNHEVRSRFGVIVGGQDNSILSTTSTYAFIGGGQSNTIDTSTHAAIVAGQSNSIGGTCLHSFIGAGLTNSNGSPKSSIVGGSTNTISGAVSHVFIGGGEDNTVTASTHASIVGGDTNTISTACTCSFIGGGISNMLEGTHSVIVGGSTNAMTTSNFSFIGGGQSNTINTPEHCVVVGGQTNGISTVSPHSFLGGGQGNLISSSPHSVIVGGADNTIEDSTHSAILCGLENIIDANSEHCAIIGGIGNEIEEEGAQEAVVSTILGGASLKVGAFTVGYHAPSHALPWFPAAVDITAFTNVAYFGNVDVWVGNTNNTPKKVKFFTGNTDNDYSSAVYVSIEAFPIMGGGSYELLWPAGQPVAGDALRCASVAGNICELEWSP